MLEFTSTKTRARLAVLGGAVITLMMVPRPALAQSSSDVVEIAPRPVWVDLVTADSPSQTDHHDLPGGQSFALYEQQVHAALTQSYVHVVKDIVNETGVQSGANLTFSFDPSFEKLALHELIIIRGTQRLDRLAPTTIRVIQQETDLDRQIYNGALSALVFIEDVRVGDRVDYAYTVSGVNPALRQHFVAGFGAGLAVPVQRLRYRLIWPSGRFLRHKVFGTIETPEPRVRRAASSTEYVWDWRDRPAVIMEDAVPSWYPAYPWVQLSEFPDWADVAVWANGLYAATNQNSDELRHCLEGLRPPGSPRADQLESALRFVQNNIRYLGMEFGPNAYRPTDPSVVLKRRFGDCKDKSFLLCELLRQLEFEATPVLVGTGYGSTVADLLPSPYAFNHIIVRVAAGDRVYWVDPTRTYQRAPLAERYLPDYGCGLLIRAGETGLTPIPRSLAGLPETLTYETIKVNHQKEPATLEVVSTAVGFDAEWLRASVASLGREGMARQWLNDYSQRYAGIAPTGTLAIEDSTGRDEVTVRHRYTITNLWVLSDDHQTYTCSFFPQGIQAWIAKPSTTIRTMPMELSHPRHRMVQTTVHLPSDWPLTNTVQTIEGPAASLNVTRTYRDKTLVMAYDYRTHTNEVSGRLLGEHLRSLDRMNDGIGYTLTWQNEALLNRAVNRMNWPIFTAALIYALVLVALAIVALRHRLSLAPRPPPPPDLTQPALSGIAGWLILVALGLIVTPFRCAFITWQSGASYAKPVWLALTTPGGAAYHPVWAPMLIFELFANITIAVFAISLLVLFFRQRHEFVKGIIVYLCLNLCIAIADQVGSGLLGKVLEKQFSAQAAKATLQSLVACFVWIPYMRVSRRVKATFFR
jgi:transglutaminase-like putative cysteine protease